MWYLLLLFVVAANANPLEVRIVGGHDAEITDYPYMVSLLTPKGYWCGGAIISEWHVLTTASCIAFSTEQLHIRAGSASNKYGGSRHHIAWNVTHKNWREDRKNIAVVKVLEPFQFLKNTQPIKLASPNDYLAPNTPANVTGWGQLSANESKLPEILQALKVTIVDRKTCNEIYKPSPLGGIVDGEICAGNIKETDKDICVEDAGSPLVVKDRLIGIASHIFMCGALGYSGIYTDVAYFREWIKEHTSV